MEIKNIKLYPSLLNIKARKTLLRVAISTAIVAGTLTGCGNKQLLDFNKSFNYAIEVNNDSASVVGISSYKDYEGTQVEFATDDGLMVLTSTNKTQLINDGNSLKIDEYAAALVGGDDSKVIDYNSLQGIDDKEAVDGWNKKVFDFNYVYNQAIIIEEGHATIVDLKKWKDYEDDKIQLQLTNGFCILTHIDGVKLVNSENASEDSLKNYALSLVGDESKISYYSYEKESTKSR